MTKYKDLKQEEKEFVDFYQMKRLVKPICLVTIMPTGWLTMRDMF